MHQTDVTPFVYIRVFIVKENVIGFSPVKGKHLETGYLKSTLSLKEQTIIVLESFALSILLQ